MSHFLAMGGYAAFVWPAYGVAALGLAGITILSWRALSRKRRELADDELPLPERERVPCSDP